MGVLFPNQGKRLALEVALKKLPAEDLDLRLFVNDKVPAAGDTEADYVEAAGAGYAAIQLVAATWTVLEADPADATYPQQTWNFSGPLTLVYGYYYTHRTSGKLFAVERFADGPYNIAQAGDQVKVTPRLKFAQAV